MGDIRRKFNKKDLSAVGRQRRKASFDQRGMKDLTKNLKSKKKNIKYADDEKKEEINSKNVKCIDTSMYFSGEIKSKKRNSKIFKKPKKKQHTHGRNGNCKDKRCPKRKTIILEDRWRVLARQMRSTSICRCCLKKGPRDIGRWSKHNSDWMPIRYKIEEHTGMQTDTLVHIQYICILQMFKGSFLDDRSMRRRNISAPLPINIARRLNIRNRNTALNVTWKPIKVNITTHVKDVGFLTPRTAYRPSKQRKFKDMVDQQIIRKPRAKNKSKRAVKIKYKISLNDKSPRKAITKKSMIKNRSKRKVIKLQPIKKTKLKRYRSKSQPSSKSKKKSTNTFGNNTNAKSVIKNRKTKKKTKTKMKDKKKKRVKYQPQKKQKKKNVKTVKKVKKKKLKKKKSIMQKSVLRLQKSMSAEYQFSDEGLCKTCATDDEIKELICEMNNIEMQRSLLSSSAKDINCYPETICENEASDLDEECANMIPTKRCSSGTIFIL